MKQIGKVVIPMYFIGIDVGTTGTKAAVVDENGHVLGKGYREYALIPSAGGRVEQNAEDWWDATVSAVREAVSAIRDPENVRAVSLSTQGGSTLAVDCNFKPLTNALTWMDTRASEENAAIANEYADYIYKTGGWQSAPFFDPSKLRWLAANQPDVFRGAYSFVSTQEFVQYRLTGKNIIDPTNAAMRQLVNVRKGTWDAKLLEISNITEERLPQCLPTGTLIGSLTPEAAQALTLSESVKVYNGAHDQYCAALGSGTIHAGDMLLSTGTTWVVLGVSEEPLFTDTFIAPGVHPCKGLYGNITTLKSAGSALKWYRQLTGEDFRTMDAEAEKRRDSAEGLLYYPYYAGSGFPHYIDEVKACCLGMELMHDKYDLARALMEGVAFETRMSLEEFARHGASISHLKMVGGAAKSHIWSEITCNVTGCEIQFPQEADTCCIGAAMLAAVGEGFYENYNEAAERMVLYSETMTPNSEDADFYQRKYERYCANFANIRNCFR